MIELMRVNGLAAGAADSLAGGRRQVSTGSDRAFRALSLVLKVRPPRTGITLSTIGFEAVSPAQAHGHEVPGAWNRAPGTPVLNVLNVLNLLIAL